MKMAQPASLTSLCILSTSALRTSRAIARKPLAVVRSHTRPAAIAAPAGIHDGNLDKQRGKVDGVPADGSGRSKKREAGGSPRCRVNCCRRRRREFPWPGTESDESSPSRSSSIRSRRRRMNPDEHGDDNTGFGRGAYMPSFYGGWKPRMQPAPQMYQYYPGSWTAALNEGLMPQQFPPSNAAPAPIPPIVSTTVNTAEASVMQETQVGGEGGSQTNGRRRKAAPTRAKLPNRHPKEDVFLVQSWLAISQDPVVNTGQKREGFWARIVKRYNLKRGSFPERSLRSLQSRFEYIKAEVSKFSGYMANVVRDNPSGKTDADKTSLALANFADIEGYPFELIHCWDLLKDEPKWTDLAGKGAQLRGDDPIDDHLPSAAINIDDDPATPSSQQSGSKRPMGRDAARRAAKKAASSSPSESSAYVSKMHDLSIQKISLWQEENEKRSSRYDQLAALELQRFEEQRAHNQLMAEIEAEKVRLMRVQANRDQTHEEERLLNIDVDTCCPKLRKYYAKKQKQILQSIGADEDDSDDRER